MASPRSTAVRYPRHDVGPLKLCSRDAWVCECPRLVILAHVDLTVVLTKHRFEIFSSSTFSWFSAEALSSYRRRILHKKPFPLPVLQSLSLAFPLSVTNPSFHIATCSSFFCLVPKTYTRHFTELERESMQLRKQALDQSVWVPHALSRCLRQCMKRILALCH